MRDSTIYRIIEEAEDENGDERVQSIVAHARIVLGDVSETCIGELAIMAKNLLVENLQMCSADSRDVARNTAAFCVLLTGIELGMALAAEDGEPSDSMAALFEGIE